MSASGHILLFYFNLSLTQTYTYCQAIHQCSALRTHENFLVIGIFKVTQQSYFSQLNN